MGNDELGGIDWLATCTKRDQATVRRLSDIVTLPAGTVLMREGDASRWFYAVVSGEATAKVDGDVVGTYTAGQSINDLEVMRNVPASTTVVAATELRVLVMGRREFLGMVDEIPGVARRLLLPRAAIAPRVTGRRPRLVPLPAA